MKRIVWGILAILLAPVVAMTANCESFLDDVKEWNETRIWQIKDGDGITDLEKLVRDAERKYQSQVEECDDETRGNILTTLEEVKKTLVFKKELMTMPNRMLDGCEFTVSEYDDRLTYEYDWQKPKKDYQHLAIFVEIVNKGNRRVEINPVGFKIKDKEGRMYSAQSSRMEPRLPSTKLEAGDRVSGWITYEIPWNVYKEDLRIKVEHGYDSSYGWMPVWE